MASAADQHADTVTSLTRSLARSSISASSLDDTGSRPPSSFSNSSSPGPPWPEMWMTSHPSASSSTARSRCLVTPYCSTRTSAERPLAAIPRTSWTSSCRSRRRLSGCPPSGRLNSPSTRSRASAGTAEAASPDPAANPAATPSALSLPAGCMTSVTSRKASGTPFTHASSSGRNSSAFASSGTMTRTAAGRSRTSAPATGPNTSAPIHAPTSPTIRASSSSRRSGAARQLRHQSRSANASYCQHRGSSRTS